MSVSGECFNASLPAVPCDGWQMRPQCAKNQGRRSGTLCWVWHSSCGWESAAVVLQVTFYSWPQDADLQCNQDDSSVDEGSDGGKLCVPIQRNNHQQEGLNSSKAISEGVRGAVDLMAPQGPWWWIPATLHSKAGNHGATNVRCICLGWDLPH